MKIDGCNALITGASAGIGREFARQLAGRVRSIVLVARRHERLEELRDELVRRNPNLIIHVRAVDLADKPQLDALAGWIEQEKMRIDLLINNAGFGDLGAFATGAPARIEGMILVNILALTALTRRLLPHMIEKKHGAILNVSSSAGFLPISDFAVYAASKAYVTSFSEALGVELHGKGVTVCALCPGPVHTEFTKVAHRPESPPDRMAPEFVHVSAEAVAREGLAAIERNQPLVIPGLAMKLGMLFVRLTPMPILRLVSRRSGKPA